MQIFLAIMAFSFLIIVHELGHFTVAKLSGVKVLEFSLFMGPKLFSMGKGETQYSLRLIPIGGYVKMEGEEQASDDSRAFNKKPVLTRMAVIVAGPLMNLFIAFLFFLIITFVAGYNTTKIDYVAPTTAAEMAGLQKGDTIIEYNGKSVYSPGDIDLFAYGSKGKPVEIKFKRNGETITKTIQPDIFPKDRFIIGFTPQVSYGQDSNIIKSLDENSPAAKVLKPGDKIVRLNNNINDKFISNNRDIRDFMNKNGNKTFDIYVERNGSQQKFNLTPIQSNNPEYYEVGVDFTHEYGGIIDNSKHAVITAYAVSRNIYYTLTWLVTGKLSPKQMSGPVGIVSVMGDVVKYSPSFKEKVLNLLSLTALISINLGLVNLIPFPALDGSKLLLLTIEGIRRKAIPPEREALITLIGMGLLITLMLFITYNDILKLVSGG